MYVLFNLLKVASALFLVVVGAVWSAPVDTVVEAKVELVRPEDRARVLLPDCTSVLASSLPECQVQPAAFQSVRYSQQPYRVSV